MHIREAEKKDIGRIMDLLRQVLEIHAQARPDIFVSGTTKYNEDELIKILEDPSRKIYVAADEDDILMGYAFCEFHKQPDSVNLIPFTSIYIDDLCVDECYRGQHIGENLFSHIRTEAKRLGCYEITLNVWRGNETAERFYEKMGFQIQKKHMEYIL